jgi:hypothetical protein
VTCPSEVETQQVHNPSCMTECPNERELPPLAKTTSLRNFQCLQVLLQLPKLRLMPIDGLGESPQSREGLFNLLAFLLQQCQCQYIQNMWVLIELKALISLQQLSDAKQSPNHSGSVLKNPPPAPGSLFLGVAIRSALGRDLTRVPKQNQYLGNRQVG